MGMGAGETNNTIGGASTMGAAIAFLRRLTGLSQYALAARIDMHRNYFGALERGTVENPGLVTVSRVAGGLDVSIGVLAANFVRTSAMPPSVRSSGDRLALSDDAYDGAREMGSAIQLMRRRAELTQARLSDATGVHRGHIASVEAGAKRNPGLRTVARIASGISSGPDELSDLVVDFTRVFAGELTVHELRNRVPATSGPPVSLGFPLEGTGN